MFRFFQELHSVVVKQLVLNFGWLVSNAHSLLPQYGGILLFQDWWGLLNLLFLTRTPGDSIAVVTMTPACHLLAV